MGHRCPMSPGKSSSKEREDALVTVQGHCFIGTHVQRQSRDLVPTAPGLLWTCTWGCSNAAQGSAHKAVGPVGVGAGNHGLGDGPRAAAGAIAEEPPGGKG